MLRDALPHIGDVQVRNRGTIGGSIAHADPASDLPACLLALDAELVIRSAGGERTTADRRVLRGRRSRPASSPARSSPRSALPGPRDDAGSAYATLEQPASGLRHGRRRGGRLLERRRRRLAGANVALTGVGDMRLPGAGRRGGARRLGRLGGRRSPPPPRTPPTASTVTTDIHADRAYRTAMAAVYTRRAIEAALARLR